MNVPRQNGFHTFLSKSFGLHHPLSRLAYLVTGAVLLPLKYTVEATTLYSLTGKFYSPLDYLNPLISSREYFAFDAPQWLGMAWVVWSLPFLYLAVTLSIRRAFDAAISPWFGLVMLVPIANLLLMVLLAIIPSGYFRLSADEQKEIDEVYAPPRSFAEPIQRTPDGAELTGTVLGLAAGAAYLVLTVVVCVYGFGSYGASLFFGTPIITGAVAAYYLNHQHERSMSTTMGHSFVTLSIACAAFLVFGLEGIICIAMAIPIMVPLGMFGGFIGHSIAGSLRRTGHSEQEGLWGCMILLPIMAAVESNVTQQPTLEVATSVTINAPIDSVWQNVIVFSDIEADPEWFFRLGISYPIRARIEGAGVGATRTCEFTTGSFIEPITVWNPPNKLTFEVTDQPEPMFELTPYRHIHPPHLSGSFRSVRGEFRLITLGDSTTRLEGHTWYELKIHPLSYWTLWTDWILHRIHLRVLNHIKLEAEQQQLLIER